MIFLGIDTSCYTTSIAAVDENGNVLSDQRKLLNVPDGQRGLRQSEGFYQHVNALPTLYEKLLGEIDERPQCICVSATPRVYARVLCGRAHGRDGIPGPGNQALYVRPSAGACNGRAKRLCA